MLPRKTDVVVVGGGVIGSSILYHLSKRKIQAVLLEKGELISGTSGACDGLIFLQSKKPGPHLRLAQEGTKRFSNLKDELHFDIEYRNSGGMIVIENDHELEVMERFVAEQQKIGLDISLLDIDQAREKEPSLSEKIFGSTFSPLDGKVNPLLLTHAFIRSAKKLGARVFTDNEVTGIALKSHQVRSVKTGKGEIETTTIVNAAGAYAPEIGKLVHLDIPIKPRRGQLLVTEPMPPVLNRGVLSAKYIAAKFDPALAETEGEGISIDQTSSGNFLLGSTREFVGFDTRTTHQAMTNIATQAIHIIPQLKDTHIIRAFAGLRPYTPDGLPILGNVDGVEGFIVAAGHEGDGVALSPITGEVIAELVDTNITPISLNEFRLERFNS
ncbi:MAG: FAD-binding oxidoreductase [Deltaproteobacteria bacterium]|nr:MAG: FAD-binding oxidoreductase [Deltaproteobacteria bacterium]